MVFVLIAVILAFFGLVIFIQYHLEKKRTEKLTAAAAELGFEFLPKPDGTFLGPATNSELLQRGHSRQFFNVLRDVTNDLKVVIFDFRYVTGSGHSRQTHVQTDVGFHFDEPALPAFTLQPENFGHKIAGWFGSQDIDLFDTHPTFSKRYLLRGPDEPAIRELFQPAVLEFFEGERALCVAGVGNYIVVFRHRASTDPAKIRELLEDGFRVFGTFRGRS